ncbi:MAG: hypothetical protein P4L53_15800 [Candidatus Obscuribacterales bacterium]|nr:hypothetical protein [Candidatus Obscuribacterales bacterium]
MFKFGKLKWIAVPLLTLVISNISFCCPSANAGDAATDQAIVDLIRHAKIINPAYKLTASVSGEEALVTTQRKPKATDAECKIQSVLIAKTAFEALPESVQRVTVIFLDYDADASSSVIVKRAEVKLFGSGGLTEKDLLSSLVIATTGATSATSSGSTSVQAGPAQADRLLLLGRIENLKKQGTNVNAYMAYFNQIEEAAKAGDEKSLTTKIAYLREHLTDQEKMVKQAHAISKGVHSGMGTGTGTGSSAFEQMARQFSAGNLPKEQVDMAMREAALSSTATAHNKDIRLAQPRLNQLHELMNAKRFSEANKIMTELEAEYSH